MTALYCTVCGRHLYDRAAGMFGPDEIVSPVGMTRPDGALVLHMDRLHWCGCPEPAKGVPSLTDEKPDVAA